MCGELRLENEKIKINSFIRADLLTDNPFYHSNYQWTGFARVEGNIAGTKSMAAQWQDPVWKITMLQVNGFVEKDTHFNFRQQTRLGCIVSRSGELKLITRAAQTEKEKAVHHRMPSGAPVDMPTEDYIDMVKKHAGYH